MVNKLYDVIPNISCSQKMIMESHIQYYYWRYTYLVLMNLQNHCNHHIDYFLLGTYQKAI